jgi:hypothetical protein
LFVVPDGVVKALPDGGSGSRQTQVDHPGNHTPGGAGPGFLRLRRGGVYGAGGGHDVHHAVGARVEFLVIIAVDGVVSAQGVGVGHDAAQPEGFGIPFAAQLIAHDAGGGRAARVDLVIGPSPEFALVGGLSRGEPARVLGRQCVVAHGDGELSGGLAGRQEESTAIGRVAG